MVLGSSAVAQNQPIPELAPVQGRVEKNQGSCCVAEVHLLSHASKERLISSAGEQDQLIPMPAPIEVVLFHLHRFEHRFGDIG